MSKIKIEDMDLYDLLSLSMDCTAQEIKRAYRKKALVCHPDKNPDNPKAAELFHQLSEALKILTDESARSIYDKVLRAKKAAILRHKDLDLKRKKFKDDLEAREQAARLQKDHVKSDEEKLQAEIERLRKEGQQLVQDEMEYLSRQVNKEFQKKVIVENGTNCKIKISWNVGNSDSENNGYDDDTLHRLLSKYGEIVAIVSSKNKGTALVEFETKEAAELAYQLEQGMMSNPLTLRWMDKEKRQKKDSSNMSTSQLITDRDYESLVMRKLRQAEERKQLIEQMENEDSG